VIDNKFNNVVKVYDLVNIVIKKHRYHPFIFYIEYGHPEQRLMLFRGLVFCVVWFSAG
jgi:hypothetical protein